VVVVETELVVVAGGVVVVDFGRKIFTAAAVFGE
jgi:hypothetical protein